MKLRSSKHTAEDSNNKKDKDRLYMAAKNGNVDEITYLMSIKDVDADFLYDNEENIEGCKRALDAISESLGAIRYSDEDDAAKLATIQRAVIEALGGSSVNDEDYETPLDAISESLDAIRHSNEDDTVKLAKIENAVYTAKMAVNAAKKDHGESPVHAAIRNEKQDALTTLLSLGASFDFRNKLGDTPFLTATAEGNLEAMETLYSETIPYPGNQCVINDTHTNTQNEEICTPLMYSAIWGRYEAARWLLEPAHSIDTPQGKTNALFETLTYRRDYGRGDYRLPSNDLINLIIQNGADLTHLNDNDQTPLHLALDRGIDILIEHDHCPDMMIEEAEKTITIATMLLEAGDAGAFNVKCTSDFTPLGQIAWAFALFIDYGNSTNDTRLSHETALNAISDSDEDDDVKLAKIQIAVIAKLTHLLKEHGATMTLDIDSMVATQGETHRESFQQFQTLLDNTYPIGNTENHRHALARLFREANEGNGNGEDTSFKPLKRSRN